MNVRPSNQLLLVWSNPKERRTLSQILAATGAQVEFVTPEEESRPSYDRYRLIIVDYDAMKEHTEKILAEATGQPNPPSVLVMSASREKTDLISLLSHDSFSNFIAKNIQLTTNELVVTVQKILRDDIFGLEKYMTWGIATLDETLKSSADKTGVMDRVEGFLTQLGINSRLIRLATGTVDEFVMNAVYNAPVDKDGNPKYAMLPRTTRVDLEPTEYAKFRMACDGTMLAMSVEDRFGRLKPATVTSYLRKCFLRGDDQIDDKDGGAGLGLYYIFESLNSFIINIHPERRTEMIGLMDVSGTYREFAERPKSLNLFRTGRGM